MTKQLKITQVRSVIGSQQKHKLTMRAIGFRHHQQTLTKNDTPQLRGMLNQVRHLIVVEEVKAASKPASKPAAKPAAETAPPAPAAEAVKKAPAKAKPVSEKTETKTAPAAKKTASKAKAAPKAKEADKKETE